MRSVKREISDRIDVQAFDQVAGQIWRQVDVHVLAQVWGQVTRQVSSQVRRHLNEFR